MKIKTALITSLAALAMNAGTADISRTAEAADSLSASEQTDDSTLDLKVGANFQYTGNETASRYNWGIGNIDLFAKTSSTEETTDTQALGVFPTKAGTFWLRYQDKESDGTERATLGYDITVKGQYLLPIFAYVNKDLELEGNFFLAEGTVKGLEYGLALEYLKNDPSKDTADTSAGFAIYNTENISFLVGKHFNDNLRTTISGKVNGTGFLADLESDTSNGDYTFVGYLAQNGTSAASKKGTRLTADVYIIGIPAEKEPFVTSAANKSEEGLVLKSIVKRKKDDLSVNGQLGLMHDGFGLTVSSTFTGDGSSQELYASKRFDNGTFVEVKMDKEGIAKAYLAYAGEF